MAGRLVCQTQVPGTAGPAAFSSDGAAVAVTSSRFAADGTFAEAFVQVSDARTGAQRFLTAFAHGLNQSVVFSPDGGTVAASGVHSILVLDAASGARRWTRELPRLVLPPTFSPDGRVLLSGSSYAAMLFSAETGEVLWEWEQTQLKALAFSPDGNTIAKGCQDPNAVGLVIVADTLTGRTKWALHRDEWMRTLAYSGDGASLAIGGSVGMAGLIEAETGAVRGLFAHAGTGPDLIAIRFSPDSKLVATWGGDWVTRVYDANTLRLLHTFPSDGGLATQDLLEFNADSKSLLLAKGRKQVRSMDLETGAEQYTLEHSTGPASPIITWAALSRDGKRVVISGGDGRVKVFDPFGVEAIELGHNGPVRAVAFAADGQAVATGSDDRTARVFAVATGDELARLPHVGVVRAVAWIPTRRTLATGSDDGLVRIFDLAAATEPWSLRHQGPVVAVAASVDGRKVATGSEDGTARLIDLDAAAQQARVSHDGPVVAVVFSGDKKWLGTASADGTARLINTVTGAEHLRLTLDGPVRAVAFSADGRWFAVGDDRSARVFDIETGGERCRVDHSGAVLSLAFHPDSAVVVTGSADGVARTFAVPSGQPMATRSHAGPVRMVAFSASGLAATASDDRTARVFVADSGVEQVRLDHPKPVVAVAFSPDGRRLATACEDGAARIFEM